MSILELKKKALSVIDSKAIEIIEVAESIWRKPELGYKEFDTARLVEKKYDEMDLCFENKIAITGSKAYLKKKGSTPTVGIIGELDAIKIPEHPDCDPITSAVHACGHNAQIAVMLGAGFGLKEVIDDLSGNVVLMAVPSEEGSVELEFKGSLRDKGLIEFTGGKQEFIRVGQMKDIDLCIGSHTQTDFDENIAIGGSNNGNIRKQVKYIGREAHAAAKPHDGINALNAAMLGLMGVNALRETFRDEDMIRVHPIITKGGEISNNVPADVRIECGVRGKTVEAMKDANIKVNRALKAGAMALGAEIIIQDAPGFMPYHKNPQLTDSLHRNAVSLIGEKQVKTKTQHDAASTDLGDFSCILPTSSLHMGGCSGKGHTRTFKIVNPKVAYILPAKIIALTVIDLLGEEAKLAKEIKASFKPSIPPDKYTEFMRNLVS
jgi:amidohydrolase